MLIYDGCHGCCSHIFYFLKLAFTEGHKTQSKIICNKQLTLRMSLNDAIKMDFYNLHSIVIISGIWWRTITTTRSKWASNLPWSYKSKQWQCCRFPIIPHLFILIAIFSCLFSSSRTFFYTNVSNKNKMRERDRREDTS